MGRIVLGSGKDRSLVRRHPWVFSGAVAKVSEELADGDVVEVVSSKGEWLGRGFFSRHSSIAVRILTFEREEEINGDFFKTRLLSAWNARAERWNGQSHNAVRWVHGEGDGLPGLVIDRYSDVISLQLLTSGMDIRRDTILKAISGIFPECSVYERSDVAMRKHEGLDERKGLLVGKEPNGRIPVAANGLKWFVSVESGHKTGGYLDQVDNWNKVGVLAKGKDVLDAFCYGGGFALSCLKSGAKSVLAVDSSQPALDVFAENMRLNEVESDRCAVRCCDVFTVLREFRDRGKSFDMIILDPPKFADSKGHVEKACRAYKDINLLAFKLLRPDGVLATFSCSGGVSPELFQKVVADAALDAKRDASVIDRYTQAPDHPVALPCPEGLYLKGLLVRCRG